MKDPDAVSLGRRGGLKGGPARAASMTPEERSASAHRAAQARWAKSRKGSATQKRYRERYRGTCEVCGAKTSEPRFNRCGEHNRSRTKNWSKERVIEAMQLWRLVYGKNPSYDDWDGRRKTKGDAERFAEWHTAGLIPWNTTVKRLFGSWSAATVELEGSRSTLVLAMVAPRGYRSPHGTVNRYKNYKCRCGACREAHRIEWSTRAHKNGRRRPMKVWLAERRANPPPHGTETRYTGYMRCRCDECRTAASAARARRRARA